MRIKALIALALIVAVPLVPTSPAAADVRIVCASGMISRRALSELGSQGPAGERYLSNPVYSELPEADHSDLAAAIGE